MRIRLALALALSLLLSVTFRVTAQEPVDTTAEEIPDLAGQWMLSTPLGAGFHAVTLEQDGARLKATFSYSLKCNGQGFVVRTTMEGSVSAQDVRLRATDGRLEGDFRNECAAYARYVGQEIFRGNLSVDQKKISGPSDLSGSTASMWTFTRVPAKGEKQ